MTRTMKQMFSLLALVVLMVCMPLTRAGASDDLPPGVKVLTPDQIKWVTGASGRQSANLLGDPKKPGPYIYLVKWAPNDKEVAHKHPEDRYGMVISGVHYIGYGDKFDAKKLHADRAGSYFTEPANTAHFGMTKGEGAILCFYGVGPTGSTRVEAEETRKKQGNDISPR